MSVSEQSSDYRTQGGSGLWSWLTTLDHKRIGIMYLFTTLFFFSIAGFAALLIRFAHLTPDKTHFAWMTATTYNKTFTLHGAMMIFMFIIPNVPGALGNFFLPIMLGAKDVAFPRLNLISYYLLVV